MFYNLSIRPEFAEFRSLPDKKPRATRLPQELTDQLEIYAEAEGDNLAGLLFEGAIRVLQDRQNDPDYWDNLRQGAAESVEALQHRLPEGE